MNKIVENILPKALSDYALVCHTESEDIMNDLREVFYSEANFLDKCAAYDDVIDNYPKFEELREVIFDLLMYNFFQEDVKRLQPDYLDTEEWDRIEAATIDRGTELLNLLLYIEECKQEEIKPELDDFLKEFLLIDDDDFQEELDIYESLIANQDAVNEDTEDIISLGDELADDDDMKAVIVPFLLFFKDVEYKESTVEDLRKSGEYAGGNTAIYSILTLAYEND